MALRSLSKSSVRRLISSQLIHAENAELPLAQQGLEQLSKHFTTSASNQTPIHIEEEVYNRQRQIIILGNRVPTLAPDAWVAPSAVIAGDVDIYERVSIWYNCVLRGDLNSIRVGAFSNIQDRTVVHAARSSPTGLSAATNIGRNVTVGQSCVLRSVTIQDECIVGDKCILLEGSVMEKNSVLAPGSIVPPGRRIPAGQLWGGIPAAYIRDLTKDEKMEIAGVASSVFPTSAMHAGEFLPNSSAYREAENLRKILKPDSALYQGSAVQAGEASA